MQRVKEEMSRRGLLGLAGAAAAAALASQMGSEARAQEATPAASPMASPMAMGPGALPAAVGNYTQIVDLTHLITPEIPVWPGNPSLVMTPFRTYAEHGFYANELNYVEHTGTHLDAPAHFFDGEPFAWQLPVANFVVPLVVIDITEKAAADPDSQVTPDDVEGWISANGEIPASAFVAMNSGWAAKVGDPEAFVNLDADGVQHYPGFHPEATIMMVEKGIAGVGVDTLSLDYGASTDFGTHIAILSAGGYGIEGLAGLNDVPASGATIIVGAPKFDRNSGGPSRVYALIP
jgi:kynurenine formamidase